MLSNLTFILSFVCFLLPRFKVFPQAASFFYGPVDKINLDFHCMSQVQYGETIVHSTSPDNLGFLKVQQNLKIQDFNIAHAYHDFRVMDNDSLNTVQSHKQHKTICKSFTIKHKKVQTKHSNLDQVLENINSKNQTTNKIVLDIFIIKINTKTRFTQRNLNYKHNILSAFIYEIVVFFQIYETYFS